MMMDVWTFLWLLVCFTILISVLESLHRRIKERQLYQQEQELQARIQAQQYHVYTLQPFAVPTMQTRSSSTGFENAILTAQQQQYIHQQQELKACEDLPPKYEDVVGNYATIIPIDLPSSSAENPTSNAANGSTTTPNRTERY